MISSFLSASPSECTMLTPMLSRVKCHQNVVQYDMMLQHYGDVIMGTIASEITSLTIVYSTVYSDADQRKHQSSMSLAFVWGPVNSPHKWPVTRKMFPFDDVIMNCSDTIRIWIRAWTHRRHSIPHPNRWAMGYILLGFWRKLTLLKWCYTVFCYGVLNFNAFA